MSDLFSYQQEILDHPARFKVLAAGRRFGKTELGKVAIWNASGHRCWMAMSYRAAIPVWRDLRTSTSEWDNIATINEQTMTITIKDGGSISIRSTHQPDNLSGAGLDFVVLDEAAYMSIGVWHRNIRPLLLDRQGSALFISTPYGRNWFWEVYQLGVDPTQPEWKSWHYPTSMNPHIHSTEIERLRRELTDRMFRQEVLAAFIDAETEDTSPTRRQRVDFA